MGCWEVEVEKNHQSKTAVVSLKAETAARGKCGADSVNIRAAQHPPRLILDGASVLPYGESSSPPSRDFRNHEIVSREKDAGVDDADV